jgi:hypothetical protein
MFKLFDMDKKYANLDFCRVLLIVVTGISKPSLRQELDKILPLPKTTFGNRVENARDTFTI